MSHNSFKILSLFLLLTYCSYVFKIVFPILDYVINYSFIVEELCEQKDNPGNMCLGKCHLLKEISKQTELPSEKTEIVKIEFDKIPHTSKLNKIIIGQSEDNKQKLNLTDEKELTFLIEPLLPPPKTLLFLI